jgi:predicted AlkP superfamily pyrophosphatase or phosphodiesterase
MVIVWDAGQAGMVYQAMAAGRLPHFSELARQGLRAEYAQSVDPSLSAPAQISLVTGAYPGRTGIVSNAFHNPSDDFYWYRVGFDEPIDQEEPVWVTASRQGLTTAALFIAGARPDLPTQAADYTVGYGIRDAYSRQVNVPLTVSAGRPGMPVTYSPLLEGYFHIPRVSRVDVIVLDSSDDSQVNYDRVLISSGGNSAAALNPGNTLLLEADEWGPLIILPSLTAGADFLVQEITPTSIKLYQTGVYHNSASPRHLLEALNQQFGYFPAGPDSYALEHGWITPADYLEMLERSARWMAEVSAWVLETYSPDLLFTWQDGFDSAGHTFLLVDPRQAGFTAERAEAYRRYFERAGEIADQALAMMLRPVDLNRTSVFLTADHGITPVHTNVYVNTILEKAGLLILDKRNYVTVNKTKVLAVTSGSSVHIYINQIGVEKDGMVPAENVEAIQAQIVALLSQLTDPENGAPVFQRVLAGQELDQAGLAHPNCGDVFAQAAPGYTLDDWRGKNVIFEPATMYANHGNDSMLPEMRAMFIAAGGGIPATGRVISPLKLVDLAPTLAKLLGFKPTTNMVGKPIPGIIQP